MRLCFCLWTEKKIWKNKENKKDEKLVSLTDYVLVIL